MVIDVVSRLAVVTITLVQGKTAPTKDVPTTLESSSRQEVRMLVMEEFKREGISDKITRYVVNLFR